MHDSDALKWSMVEGEWYPGDISVVHRKLSFDKTVIQVGEDEEERLEALLYGVVAT